MAEKDWTTIEDKLAQWREKEERLSKIFTFDLSSSKAFQREKLRTYDSIARRYRKNKGQDGRLAYRLFREEKRKLEKQLYPNLLVRLARRWAVKPLKNLISDAFNVARLLIYKAFKMDEVKPSQQQARKASPTLSNVRNIRDKKESQSQTETFQEKAAVRAAVNQPMGYTVATNRTRSRKRKGLGH